MTDENIIIAARLPHDAKLKAIELLGKEKVIIKTKFKYQNIYTYNIVCMYVCAFAFTSIRQE